MEMKTTENPVEAAGPVKQVLANLFYGWGYNFYRKENQQRADDLLIRARVSEILGLARASLAAMESTFRQGHLSAPTREKPFPDAAAVVTAQALQRQQQVIESLQVRIRNAAVPEMDRVNQRHRNERETLDRLAAVDGDLVLAAKTIADAVSALIDPVHAAGSVSDILQQSGMESLLSQRAQLLSALASS